MTDKKVKEAIYQPDQLWNSDEAIIELHKITYIPKKDVKNVFEGNTYKYILTGVDVVYRYKVARTIKSKKASKTAFVLEARYKKSLIPRSISM